MSNARNHHYVPACSLKHFAVPQDRYEGRLHVYDRVTGRSFQSSPHKSAREMDFYSVEVEGESPALAEDAYAALETRFAPTIAGVNERGTLPTDPIAMRELLAFVASQAVRTPRVREMQRRAYSDVYMLEMRALADNKAAYMKRLCEWEPDISNAEAEEMFATHCEFVNAKGARVEMDQTTLVRDTLELAVELEDVLALRHWIICVAPDGTNFVTTDDPVHLVCAGRRPANPSLWSPGFGDPNTTVQVPVGPRFLLMGLPYRVHLARKRLSRAEVAATNTDRALAARRFVYFVGPTFVQIAPDGAVVDGPTDALRRRDEAPPPHSPFAGFPRHHIDRGA